MLVEFGNAGLLSKARQQPERVMQAVEKVRTDGPVEAFEAVRSKLDRALSLGYCNAGLVLEVGSGVDGFRAGDRVFSNGCHAEVVEVPKNLCAKIPEEVNFESASFTALGAIALEGVRLAAPTLGEVFVVSGLGVVGLLAVQILRANGCRVIGVDLNAERVALAAQFGARPVNIASADQVHEAMSLSAGEGVDGVIIAAATPSSEPVRQAARMCRKRGRIIAIGVTGLELSRSDFYEKELTFQVSCSYGPGRYDRTYETEGHDYPYGFVRWTERRNFEAVLALLAEGKLNVEPLISHRFPLEHARKAYEILRAGGNSLGIMLQYPDETVCPTHNLRVPTISIGHTREPIALAKKSGQPVIALVGAGAFASKILIPSLVKCRARLKYVASRSGFGSAIAARRFGFECATSDVASAINDPDVNTVVIATEHNSHAQLVCRALDAGKHVFVEKPLACSELELREIEQAYNKTRGRLALMVGFNRRFAPQVHLIKSLLQQLGAPKSLVLTVNARPLPAEHWDQDRKQGGRIIGEVCHFIDLERFLVGHPIVKVSAASPCEASIETNGSAAITMEFADGSIGTIHYLTNGHYSFPKERLEVFASGKVLVLNNFRKLRGFGWERFRSFNLWRQNKGHREEIEAFLQCVMSGSPAPIPFRELCEVTRVTFELAHAIP
jgi:predicted dehydrogenase